MTENLKSLKLSQYSGWFQLCYSLDGLNSSSYFQIFLSLYQSFGDCTQSPNYNLYHCHFHVPQFFNSLVRSFFSLSFNFTLWYPPPPGQQSPQFGKFAFCWLFQGLIVWLGLGNLFVSQNPKEVYASHSPGQIPGCAYTIWLYGQISMMRPHFWSSVEYGVISSLPSTTGSLWQEVDVPLGSHVWVE